MLNASSYLLKLCKDVSITYVIEKTVNYCVVVIFQFSAVCIGRYIFK